MKSLFTAVCGWFLAVPVMASSLGCSDVTTSSSTTGGTSMITPGSVVVNEIQATDGDWIEITNIGTQVADLSGVGLADKMADGTPEIVDAVRFDDGEKLAPGEFLLVVVNVKTAVAGPQSDCLMAGGPTRCYQAKWGVSASNGDSVFLLYPDDKILDLASYPVNAVLAGQTYCRLPSGTGTFAACKPTPAATNSAP
jgi:Lamin Tail Domain